MGMNSKDLKVLLSDFKKELTEEFSDSGFQSIYNDYDILENLKSYVILSEMFEDSEEIRAKVEKVEKAVLRALNALKITSDQGNTYYLKKGEAYDSEGCIIEYNYGDYIENEDLFCEYNGDDLYLLMKKNALTKMKSEDNYDIY